MSNTGELPNFLSVGGMVVVAVVFVIFSLFLLPWILRKTYNQLREVRITEKVGITILVAGIIAVAAHLMGLHIMIGAFLGGMAIRESLNKRVQQAIGRWAFGFFAPIFFAWVGFSVTFSGAAFSLLLPLIIVLGFVGKVFGAGLGAKLSGLSWNESFLVGLGMNGRAAVDLILASVALSSGIIDRDLYSAIVFNAVIMALLTPILLKFFAARFQKKGIVEGISSF
jgi:Kef-type K+ transport system membrane component KefB